jgi:tryptophan synthase beta subunit
MYLMAQVTMGAERVRKQMEAREAVAFHEAAAARVEADALADAATEAARPWATQAQSEAEETARRAHRVG